jgi:hypothetical protein
MSFLFHTASSELKPYRKTAAQDSKAYTHNHKQDGEATAGSITHTTAAASCAQNSTRTAVAASTDRFTASRRVARGRITGRRAQQIPISVLACRYLRYYWYRSA